MESSTRKIVDAFFQANAPAAPKRQVSRPNTDKWTPQSVEEYARTWNPAEGEEVEAAVIGSNRGRMADVFFITNNVATGKPKFVWHGVMKVLPTTGEHYYKATGGSLSIPGLAEFMQQAAGFLAAKKDSLKDKDIQKLQEALLNLGLALGYKQ